MSRPGDPQNTGATDPPEHRFHHLVDAVTDYAIFMLDASGHVMTWNAGAQKTKGYLASEIVGQHLSVFYTPEDRAAGKPERVLETVRREGRLEDESWRVRKDGTRFWADVVITALKDPSGQVVGFAKVTRDLTERRAVNEALRRSEERFRLLVESVPDYAIYMLDPDGHLVSWNAGAERMKGYVAQEIVGQHFRVFFPEADVESGKPARELEQALANGRFEDEGWRKRKDGSLFWASVIVTPLRGTEGELLGYSKSTRDLTARRASEETTRRLLREQAARAAAEASERQLRESEELARSAARRAEEEARRAENATRVKDEFLATVSHELRTPLNAMLGYASILRDRMATSADPVLLKAAEVIHRNAEAQARIVDDILDVSRIVTGKLRLDVKPMDLAAVCEEALEVVKPSALAKGLALVALPPTDSTLLVGDPERLRQVIWNLLSNAVKFTDPGGHIVLSVDRDGGRIIATVRDTGRGIAAEFLPHVFERFEQGDSSTTRRFGGLGLGLAIVRHIVELHGGQVDAESAGRGKGALFRVTLPVRAVAVGDVPEEPARPDVACPAPSDVVSSLKGVSVVVVDDDPDARDLLSFTLSAVGALVETAESAASGLEAVRRIRPDVLVSDIAMPGEDGYTLIRRMRALRPGEGGGIPSIALTAYTRTEDRTRALAAGFTTHVGKPVNPQDLVAAVANLAALARR